jgi:hypothetical protein
MIGRNRQTAVARRTGEAKRVFELEIKLLHEKTSAPREAAEWNGMGRRGHATPVG